MSPFKISSFRNSNISRALLSVPAHTTAPVTTHTHAARLAPTHGAGPPLWRWYRPPSLSSNFTTSTLPACLPSHLHLGARPILGGLEPHELKPCLSRFANFRIFAAQTRGATLLDAWRSRAWGLRQLALPLSTAPAAVRWAGACIAAVGPASGGQTRTRVCGRGGRVRLLRRRRFLSLTV